MGTRKKGAREGDTQGRGKNRLFACAFFLAPIYFPASATQAKNNYY